jgi:hypothetical protein
VKIDHEAACRLDRYLRAGPGTRRPTASGCGSGPATAGR